MSFDWSVEEYADIGARQTGGGGTDRVSFTALFTPHAAFAYCAMIANTRLWNGRIILIMGASRAKFI